MNILYLLCLADLDEVDIDDLDHTDDLSEVYHSMVCPDI